MRQKTFYVLSCLILTTFCSPKKLEKQNAMLILDTRSVLGEGPIWNNEKGQLYWIDIERRQLHIYTPNNDRLESFPTNERIGTVVPVASGGALVALQNGIFTMDLSDGAMKLITNPLDTVSDVRFNDGKCDPVGRFWVGSMAMNEKQGTASLYMMNDQHQVKKMLGNVTISNGIVWSLDQKTMYYIDTPTMQIQAFDFDVATGDITNPRVVVAVPEGMGAPDGMTIDEEGMLWVGMWGGSAVARFNPENGELIQKVEVPAINITACAFGGAQLDTLYITTATQGMNAEQLKEYPHSGWPGLLLSPVLKECLPIFMWITARKLQKKNKLRQLYSNLRDSIGSRREAL